MEQLKIAAQVAFASEFSFYLKAHEFHWNVEGPRFQELHILFENIYTEVYGIIDEFAEKLRAMDSLAPGSHSAMSLLSHIMDENRALFAEEMLSELLADSESMIVLLKRVYDIAEEHGEHGFSNFLAERMDAHRKHSWQLRSSLRA
jgi:starvation-inducible DNA-binding protein